MKLLIFLVLLITISCSNNDNIVIKEYYPSGELEYEYEATTDSIKDGYWKWFFKTGQLKAEVSYIYGLRNGALKVYLKNGNLFGYDEMTNDTINGYTRQYDYDGELVSEYFVVMGLAIEDSTKINKEWAPDGSTFNYFNMDSLGNVDSTAVFEWRNGAKIFLRPFTEEEIQQYKLKTEQVWKE